MKLAVFTPLNPARSGISDYSESLLPEIARHARVEVFIDDGYEADDFPEGVDITIRYWREYRPEDFDETLYQIGNNPFHVYAYETALKHPGVVLLHEFNLHHLVTAATISRDNWDAYIDEIAYEGDEAQLEHARRARTLETGPDYDSLPLNRRLIESAKAVIVHSEFMVGKVLEADPKANVRRIPHGAWIPEVNRHQYRSKLGIDEKTPLIGVFGFLKPYKRIQQSLRAMKRLVRVEPRAKMILVGEEHPDLPVRRMIEDFDLGEHVRVIGYAPIEEFVQWIGATDICLNLRYPTVGETSGTLLRALGLGRAVIVSDVGAFADLPQEICFKVPVDESEVEILFEYMNLLASRPDVARAVGERARHHVASECSWARVGTLFWKALSDLDYDVSPPREDQKVASNAEPEPVQELPIPEPAKTPPPPPGGEMAEYIRSYCHDRPEDAGYVETHLTRLLRTLGLTPPGGPDDAALEMGAYMHITPALTNKLGYGEVRGCYLGPRGETDTRKVSSSSGETFECEVDLFDAERDRYPYPDDRFSTVLCCELLEHLQNDPMHMVGEVNRILRPGGAFILSTPNACSLRAASALLLNYHPGLFHHYVVPDENGVVDPRHAREYAPRDVLALLEAGGFSLETLDTGPYLEQDTLEYDWVKQILQRFQLSSEMRGDAIFAVAKKVGPVQERYPAALYSGGEK